MYLVSLGLDSYFLFYFFLVTPDMFSFLLYTLFPVHNFAGVGTGEVLCTAETGMPKGGTADSAT